MLRVQRQGNVKTFIYTSWEKYVKLKGINGFPAVGEFSYKLPGHDFCTVEFSLGMFDLMWVFVRGRSASINMSPQSFACDKISRIGRKRSNEQEDVITIFSH